MLLENASHLIPEALAFPGGPLPLNSPLYVHRQPLENAAHQEIRKPGSVVRIQAPRQMGKSSLLHRLVADAKQAGYQAVSIDFQEADKNLFSSLDKFLRWFSLNVGRRLGLENRLDEYWDDEIGSKVSCTYYFEDYLLSTEDCPILLALNEVNCLFDYPEIARDFFPLLRYWHEQAKQVEIFRRLRLAIVHSTEIYVPLQIHQSPFNVGLPIRLPAFDLPQTQKLALNYGLDWCEGDRGAAQLQSLLEMVGGHPYRLAIAFYSLAKGELSLETVLQSAPSTEGIYGNHLQALALCLHKDPELKTAYREILSAVDGVEVELPQAYKLASLGLVTLKGTEAKPSCELYRRYFRAHLSSVQNSASKIRDLQAENQRLKRLAHPETDASFAQPLPNNIAQRRSGPLLSGLSQTISDFPQFNNILLEGNPQNELLGGRYRIHSKMGSGGFGQTYLAEDTHRPGKPSCVVKKLANWFSAEELAIARRLFATEAQALEKLGEHPHIPRLLAYFEQDTEFYLVQEFIEGQSLSAELDHCLMGWEEAEVITFLKEILPILTFVHDHQVIHRDLKPDNIIRRQSDGKLVLIDFGVAKHLSAHHGERSRQTVAVGTCGYSPWEQSQGTPQMNSDLYAVGMIAIESATGTHPDRLGRDSKMTLQWRSGLPHFDPWLATILDGMVHANYQDRYQSAQEVLADLNLIARHE